MPQHVVAIGASAGGLEALTAIVQRLPRTIDAAVLVVTHTQSNGTPRRPSIPARGSELSASFATDDQPLQAGHVYVAPQGFHLLVEASRLRVVHGRRENGFRPAIDPLFRTVAREFGSRVISVILSGPLSDGTGCGSSSSMAARRSYRIRTMRLSPACRVELWPHWRSITSCRPGTSLR